MAPCLSELHNNILVEILLPLLDQVSMFRLSRCSKTLYEKLKAHLPKKQVLEYFNWHFKSENIQVCWRLARKRHESGKWCLGGCGKQRAPHKPGFIELITYGRARTRKAPLNICKSCAVNRGVFLNVDRDISVLQSVKRLKRDIQERDITDPFIHKLQEYEDEETLKSSRIIDVNVGDVLIPKYQSYDDEFPDLKVVEIQDSNYVNRNKYEKRYIMEDGTYIYSMDGKRFKNYCHWHGNLYIKP